MGYKLNNRVVNRILNKSDNSLHGYFLEVDLDYSENFLSLVLLVDHLYN